MADHLPERIKAHRNYEGRTFTNEKGEELEYGRWYRFNSNVSWARISPNGYRARNNETGEVIVPAGPAGRDAVMWSLYKGQDVTGYAYHFMGDAYKLDPVHETSPDYGAEPVTVATFGLIPDPATVQEARAMVERHRRPNWLRRLFRA